MAIEPYVNWNSPPKGWKLLSKSHEDYWPRMGDTGFIIGLSPSHLVIQGDFGRQAYKVNLPIEQIANALAEQRLEAHA